MTPTPERLAIERIFAAIAFVILFLLFSSRAHADPFPPTDKVAHFGMGYVISDLTTHGLQKAGMPQTPAIICGLLTTAAVAIAKECRDPKPDILDAEATIGGGFFRLFILSW